MKGVKERQWDRHTADGSGVQAAGKGADDNGMQVVGSVLRSKAVTLCFLGIGGILTAGILAIAGTDGTLIAVLGAACLVVVILWLAVSGLLEWKRFAELEKLLEGLPERYLLGEVLPKPVNDMEKRYFQVMKEVSRSAIGIVEQARKEKEEYCDYVESWIHEMKTPLILDGAISRDDMQFCDSVPSCDNVQSCDDLPSRDDVLSRDSISSCDMEREKPTETGFMEGTSEEKTDIPAWLYERQADLRKLRRELKRADNLTESILYYARLRTAEKDVKIREFSVGKSIGEAVRSQMELLIGAGISVETGGDFTVYSDEKSLCFILKQLLINCAKYCPGCHIRIRAEEGVISVRDNGPGIPAHELHRVTERGFTGSRRREDTASGTGDAGGKDNASGIGGAGSGGTGMGLYIVKELCDRLGITMEITSKVGEFTCVTLGYGSRSRVK